MATPLYTITARHRTMIGQLPCTMSASVTVEGEYARDQILTALAARQGVAAHWEVFHGTPLGEAGLKLAQHFGEYPTIPQVQQGAEQ